MGIPRFRGSARVALTGLASLSLVTGAMLAVTAPEALASTNASSSATANPYNPSTDHAYRHGVIPTLQQNAKMKSWADTHSTTATTGPETLSYGGGVNGVGVNDGKSQVYLVFYGSQWGTQSTNSSGDATFSGDQDGAAPVAQEMFKGIGTGGELWSADLTQWCDGPNVAAGATSCPSNASFVPYQAGGVLSGVWYDNSAASPSATTGNQLGQEAVNAAAHFGNTTAASNRHTYYVIMSPTGTNPDSYQGQYCAWHDYTGDSSLTGGAVNSPYGDLAFSNQPYNMDSGSGCGVGFVNSPGTLDGWTMTLGHEYHEMMSDQFPAGGWTNQQSGSANNGQENSDECAWIAAGTAGGAAMITMGTGTFAEQASWSNDTNACAISHPILNHGNTVTVTNPGSQSGKVGTAVSLQVSGSDSASGQTLTYSATGLPAGLSISSSGLISGTPTTAATSSVTVTAKDTTGASGSASFSWTVSSTTGNTVTVNSPGNQSGTVGTAVSLQVSGSDSASGQTLTYSATGLPAGLSISSSGLISGTPTTAATSSVTVTAKDTTGASGSASFSWTIGSGSGGCTGGGQLLGNPGFETGSASPWTATAGVINSDTTSEPAHSGSYDAWLDGYGTTHTDTLSQTVTIPAGCKATFSFWLHIDTAETGSTAYDKLAVTANGTNLATYSNVNANTGYVQKSFDLSSYAGKSVTLKFTGTEDSSLQTSFVIDDTALNAS
ncbi:F0F1-type ATP synthase membrane subunit c/vacuolar-type H+-ATPase subunit K [Kitasatospora sp. GAS204A]|uniref:putative Ig domain-containing protein n=1 Tax=unclassified Kitasatospora TaxID=2633591 RepID=UPI002475D1C9|nr:putative Ig domain-containing protein [Kitasatospora sp. GAS204B]MDH6120464.1 F0F1-type ATP synthase membrane subunit c/vacuolar-type H+-ATPase subunit K [Kitasatospora sp. GAS204B]